MGYMGILLCYTQSHILLKEDYILTTVVKGLVMKAFEDSGLIGSYGAWDLRFRLYAVT